MSFDPRDVRDTIQRTVSLRAFNKSALGLIPEDTRGLSGRKLNRVVEQCGQTIDVFADRSYNAQIVYLMNKHKLWERYGLSLNACLNMRTAEWNKLIKTVEQMTLQRSQSSMEIVATVITRLEQAFTTFMTPKGK